MENITTPLPENQPTLKPLNNVPYLIVVGFMILIGFVVFAVIAIRRPDIDIVILGGTVFAFIVTMTTSIFAVMKSNESNTTSRDTHILVNSRMGDFMEELERSAQDKAVIAKQEGVKQGIDEANKRTDELNLKS